MVSPWVLLSLSCCGADAEEWVTTQEATTAAWTSCRCSDKVLRRQFKKQERPSWSYLFICVSHIGVKSSLMSSIPLLMSIAFLPSALCIVEAAGLRQRSPAECRVLLWVLTSLHSSDFHCLEFVLSQRSFWSAAYPLSCFWKHTHTQWCILHINLSDSVRWLVAKVSFEFRGSELLRPKITHETWERNRTSSHT